jgi:hypothetical protein
VQLQRAERRARLAQVGGRTVNVNFAKARAPRPEY